MKRLLACLFVLIFLTGCSGENGIDRTIELRQKILSANSCSFTADIVADYGDALYSFTLQCTFDSLGDMEFTVIKPESIAGIAGKIKGETGYLTFDQQALAFPLLADEQLTPICAPWIFMKSLRSGYIHSYSLEKDLTYVCINDSFREDALQLDVWLDHNHLPVHTEILYLNRRILTVSITDFAIV